MCLEIEPRSAFWVEPDPAKQVLAGEATGQGLELVAAALARGSGYRWTTTKVEDTAMDQIFPTDPEP